MSGRKEPPPPEQVHGDRRTKRRRQRGQEERSERPNLRPTSGPCPGCGMAEQVWCKIDCQLIDPLDY